MNISGSYDVAGSYIGYGAKKASQSSKTEQSQDNGIKFAASAPTEAKGLFGVCSQDYKTSDAYQQVDSQRKQKALEIEVEEEKADSEEGKKRKEELAVYLIKALESKGENDIDTKRNLASKPRREAYEDVCEKFINGQLPKTQNNPS